MRDHLLRDIETVARSHFGPESFASHRAEGNDLGVAGGRKANPPPVSPPTRSTPALPSTASSSAHRINLPPPRPRRSPIGPAKPTTRSIIYGGSGLGKTHLLHAIAHRLAETAPALKVVYMTTEQFVNELINCIRRKQMEAFRQTFRGVDVLLLDDIQFIAGKERTQEEFFHTFNTLQSTGRQVVFTSDARPADIPGLEERLRSRFLQGLIADIQPPDLETRCAILREKARAVGRELPEDVVLFISRRVQNNVRELEGCLNRTIAYAQLKNAKITVDVVRMALFELLPDERATSPSDIIRFVAQHYGIRVADLKGRSNRRSIALPRQVAMYLIRDILELSFPEIGKIFSKHHSTVMYAVDNVSEDASVEPRFRRHPDLVSRTLRADFLSPPVEDRCAQAVHAVWNVVNFPQTFHNSSTSAVPQRS